LSKNVKLRVARFLVADDPAEWSIRNNAALVGVQTFQKSNLSLRRPDLPPVQV
jgi:hypothetical protein